MEMVTTHKYLDIQMHHRLTWSNNTNMVQKKGPSQLYFLRRLRSFNVCSGMLHMFYQSVVASTIFCAVVCWGMGTKAKDANRLSISIRKAESVVGRKLAHLG